MFSGLTFYVVYNSRGIELQVVAVGPTPEGDFDMDGDVDGFDFVRWQRGTSPDSLSSADLNKWRGNYGAVGLLTAGATAVPEPTTVGILAIMASITLLRRQKRYL